MESKIQDVYIRREPKKQMQSYFDLMPETVHISSIRHLRLDAKDVELNIPLLRPTSQMYLGELSPTGGATIVVITDTETDRRYAGISVCSIIEHFDKKRGTNRALGYALEARERNVPVVMPRYFKESNSYVLKNNNLNFIAFNVPRTCYVYPA